MRFYQPSNYGIATEVSILVSVDSVFEVNGTYQATKANLVSILVSVDSVFEECDVSHNLFIYGVSILVSVDSVFEVLRIELSSQITPSFNPSFCGFGI